MEQRFTGATAVQYKFGFMLERGTMDTVILLH